MGKELYLSKNLSLLFGVISMVVVNVQQRDGDLRVEMELSRIPCVGEMVVIPRLVEANQTTEQTFRVDQVIHSGGTGLVTVSAIVPPV